MNPPKHSVSHRPAETRREDKSAKLRSKEDEIKEALVLLAIALLIVANVVLYLCHHYGLTSLNERGPRTENVSRVIVD